MASSDKKVRKDQKKRERAKRELAKQKRRQLRAASKGQTGKTETVDPAHVKPVTGRLRQFQHDDSLVEDSLSLGEPADANPEITQWWDRYMEADGSARLSMVREKLSEEIDKEWQSALFPDAVYESESASDSGEYIALLETMATDHRDLYDEGELWFLRSRVSYYLSLDSAQQSVQRIGDAVSQDAVAMKKTSEAYYGIVSMLRLAGLTEPADTLAEAGFRLLDESALMPWAVDKLFHFFIDSHVRQCVADGGDADAIKRLESVLEKNNANMEEDVVLLRAEMIRRMTGKTKTKWVPNQLLGTNQQSAENRYLLSFEFSHWLTSQRGIPPIAADELRGLVLGTLSSDWITMRSYFDGLSQTALDKHLAGLLGFMSLDRFKAPATLIAVEHFISFLHDIGLAKLKAHARSMKVITKLNTQLQRALGQEWASFAFLDSLKSWEKVS